MNTSESKSPRSRSRGPRRGRRGGRGNNNSQGGSGNSSSTYTPRHPRPAKPKTLWEKILGLFGVGAKPAAKSTGKAATARAASSAAPASAPRSDRPDRGDRDRSGGRPPRSGEAAGAPRAKRVPENVEVTSSRLYVGNLSFDATESDLSELFNGVGQVQYAEVVSNPHTHRSKGFAFVQMQTIEEAKRAVRELHNKDFMGRPLVVSGAKSQREEQEERDAKAAEASA